MCALTPYYDASSKGSSNKENEEPDQPLHTRDFCFVHRYARVAHIFWHAHNCFPDRLVGLFSDILSVANCQVIPEYSTNIDKHNPVDWVNLYDALQTHKEELARFTEGESNPETSGEEGEGEGTIKEDIKITCIESGPLSGTSPQ